MARITTCEHVRFDEDGSMLCQQGAFHMNEALEATATRVCCCMPWRVLTPLVCTHTRNHCSPLMRVACHMAEMNTLFDPLLGARVEKSS
jgi:hypothetical protein